MSVALNGNSTDAFVESIKILLLGVIVYLFSLNLFFRVGGCWFPELEATSKVRCRVTTLRQRFWWAFAAVLTLLVIVLAVLYLLDAFPNGLRNHLRIAAALVALTATLGRGGRAIETFPQQTVVERIDRGMFVIAQLGTTVLLLVALGL